MHRGEINLTWKQYLAAAVVGLIVALLIYSVEYASTILPIHLRTALNDMSHEEITTEIEEILENRYRGNWTTSEVTLDQCTLTLERTGDSACDAGGSYWFRSVTLDISSLRTRPDRVRTRIVEAREHERLGRIPEMGYIKWDFTSDAADRGERLADEARELLTEWRDRIGWGSTRHTRRRMSSLNATGPSYGRTMTSSATAPVTARSAHSGATFTYSCARTTSTVSSS